MFVYVISKRGKPLMPCKPVVARLLLKDGKAKVKRKTPFIIKLLVDTTEHTQPVIAGMDTGSKNIGCAAIANGQVIYQSEVQLRQDVSKKMTQRKMYRRTRRSRKLRYRKARWLNRASMRGKGRLAPSIQSKLDSHLREKKFVEKILPITKWTVETASFDIHKITSPDVFGKEYQEGNQKDFYNIKAYILHRDEYKCRSGQKNAHSKKLHVHHIIFKSNGGTNTPDNLITLCENCHDVLHNGEFELKARRSKTKHATETGVIKSRLIKSDWNFTETFGYLTKYKREKVLQLPKTHYNDAVAICCNDGELPKPSRRVLYKKHVAQGDYQQTTGKRSEKKLPTGKLFGLRKFDVVKTTKGIGFVKGKRTSGYFAVMDIFNNTVTASVNVKKDCQRLKARTGTLTQEAAIPPTS